MSLDVSDTRNCPVAETCACGSTTNLDIAMITTQLGVHCMTICGGCVEANRLPPVSWKDAAELVGAHCVHLGCTLDEAADALEKERSQ